MVWLLLELVVTTGVGESVVGGGAVVGAVEVMTTVGSAGQGNQHQDRVKGGKARDTTQTTRLGPEI